MDSANIWLAGSSIVISLVTLILCALSLNSSARKGEVESLRQRIIVLEQDLHTKTTELLIATNEISRLSRENLQLLRENLDLSRRIANKETK